MTGRARGMGVDVLPVLRAFRRAPSRADGYVQRLAKPALALPHDYLPAQRRRLANLRQDVRARAPRWDHLGPCLSPGFPSIPIAD